MRNTSFIFTGLTATFAATAVAACSDDPPEDPTFEAIVERVFEPRCTFASCHAAPTVAASLDLTPEIACDALVNKPACLFPERTRVVPTSPDESFFFHKLTGEGLHDIPTAGCAGSDLTMKTNLLMPYGASKLPDEDLDLVRRWIAAGAECVNGHPMPPDNRPKIASLTTNNAAPLAGQTISVTVTLDRPAGDGGQRVAIENTSQAVTTPVEVVVPAAKTEWQFVVYGVQPTPRFPLRVRANDSMGELVLRISGLEIAEVLSDPIGPDDQLQWIKLHNRSSMPLNLSGYRLKAGQGNYDFVSLDLSGTIPAGGCAVVGGPGESSANRFPTFTQAIDFSPDLPYQGLQATGYALFDRDAAPLGGVTTPVDTMLVGANNNAQLLGPDAQAASPYCATPAAGLSAQRTGPTTCMVTQMQPHTCN